MIIMINKTRHLIKIEFHFKLMKVKTKEKYGLDPQLYDQIILRFIKIRKVFRIENKELENGQIYT